MHAFCKSISIEFADSAITVREFTAREILSELTKPKTESELLSLATGLTIEEIDSLSLEGYEAVIGAFRELNGKLFEKSEDKSEGKP